MLCLWKGVAIHMMGSGLCTSNTALYTLVSTYAIGKFESYTIASFLDRWDRLRPAIVSYIYNYNSYSGCGLLATKFYSVSITYCHDVSIITHTAGKRWIPGSLSPPQIASYNIFDVFIYLMIFQVLQHLKQTVDRYARTQEGFEKRLGRARKTMAYRAQVRNSQVQESRARQILRQLHLNNSRTDLEVSATIPSMPDGVCHSLAKTNSKSKLFPSSSGPREEHSSSSSSGGGRAVTQDQVGGRGHRSVRKRTKKVSTDTLYAVIIFYEFLQELASISEEQSVVYSFLYLPKSTSLLAQ